MWTDSRYHLYRDPANGMLAGVCAGIAAYFGVEPIAVRLAVVLALFLFFPATALAYIVASFALPKRPPTLFATGEEEAFWRDAAIRPDDALHGLGHRFADLETRLRAMEQQVTSGEFELHRKFRDLGR
jgi:phage shock protein C